MDNFPGAREGDQDRGHTLLLVTWVECALSALFVALRMFSRTKITASVGWDDWLMCITLVLTIAFSICVTIYTSNGGGRHVYYLTPAQALSTARLSWIVLSLAISAIATGKASVALLIMRLMEPSKWRKRFLYIVSITGFVLGGVAIITIYSQCQPVRALWDPPAGRCPILQAVNNYHIFVSSYYAFADFFLAILPIITISKLQISVKKRVGLSIVLGLGVFAGICTAIRTSYLPELTVRSDFTWIIVTLLIWNATEINVIIIAACIPVLQSLAVILFDKIKGSFSTIKRSNYTCRDSIELPVVAVKRSTTSVTPKREVDEQDDGGWNNDGSYRDLIALNRIKRVYEFEVSYKDRQDGK